jgi:hypothetical protein
LLPIGIKAGYIDPKYTINDFNPMPNPLFTQLHNFYWWLNHLNYINNKKIACLIYEYILGAQSTYLHVLKVFNKYFKTYFKTPNKLDFMSLNSLTTTAQANLYKDLLSNRYQFLNDIVKADSSQSKFLKGWIKRYNEFTKLVINSPATVLIPIALLLIYLKTK